MQRKRCATTARASVAEKHATQADGGTPRYQFWLPLIAGALALVVSVLALVASRRADELSHQVSVAQSEPTFALSQAQQGSDRLLTIKQNSGIARSIDVTVHILVVGGFGDSKTMGNSGRASRKVLS